MHIAQSVVQQITPASVTGNVQKEPLLGLWAFSVVTFHPGLAFHTSELYAEVGFCVQPHTQEADSKPAQELLLPGPQDQLSGRESPNVLKAS